MDIYKEFLKGEVGYKCVLEKLLSDFLDQTFYHATLTENVDSIMKSGLKGGGESPLNRGRSDVFITSTIESAKDWAFELAKEKRESNWSILEVDLSHKDGETELKKDSIAIIGTRDESFRLLESVKPEKISVVDKMEFDLDTIIPPEDRQFFD